MHQLVGNLLTMAVAAKESLEELSKWHGMHPQIIPAFCITQIDGRFDAKFGFDDSRNFFSLFLLIQGKNNFDSRWNICTSTMSNTSITKPASKQVTQVSIEFQTILNFMICP